MKKQIFESFDDTSLIWACIESSIHPIRGKNFRIKSGFFAGLPAGQKALLMFQVLYGHAANGVTEFYDHLSYLLSKEGVWFELRKGAEYFGNDRLSDLIAEMENLYRIVEMEYHQESSEWLDRIHIDTDPGLAIKINALDARLADLLPSSVKRIASYMRNNPGEFIQFEDRLRSVHSLSQHGFPPLQAFYSTP